MLDMHGVAREEGEGMETTEPEPASSAGAHTPSLEQLLHSPEAKLGTLLCCVCLSVLIYCPVF